MSDLATRGYYIFPDMEKWLRVKKYCSNDEVTTEMSAYLQELEQSHFIEGIQKIENVELGDRTE